MQKVTATFTIPDSWDTDDFLTEMFFEWCDAHESEWETDGDGEPICPVTLAKGGN